METGLESESFETSIDFLTFLVQKLWPKIKKIIIYLWDESIILLAEIFPRKNTCKLLDFTLSLLQGFPTTGLLGGTRVSIPFFPKTWIHNFLVYVSGFLSKYTNFPTACYS